MQPVEHDDDREQLVEHEIDPLQLELDVLAATGTQ